MSDQDYKDQYGKVIMNDAAFLKDKATEFQLSDTEGLVVNQAREGLDEYWDIDAIQKYRSLNPSEPYRDGPTKDMHPVYLTGGSFQHDGSWVPDTETVAKANLIKPEKVGKWENWSTEISGGLLEFFKHDMPAGYGTDECLFLGAGRGTSSFYLYKSDLDHDGGIFVNMTAVDKDPDLIDYQKETMSKWSLGKYNALVNNGLQEPAPRTEDYETMLSKKYDMIITTLPHHPYPEGSYIYKQQIRTAQAEIDAGNSYGAEDSYLTTPDDASMDMKVYARNRDFYTGVQKFEESCYDENFGIHKDMFRNARKFLKPDGHIVSVHNANSSDIDTFIPTLEAAGLKIVHHQMIGKGMGGHSLARHWFFRRTLITPAQGNKYVIVSQIK
tara:strand:+ start:119 stop:1270 length:1152 start_codon:yes stop_codon:yes gene_type:complete